MRSLAYLIATFLVPTVVVGCDTGESPPSDDRNVEETGDLSANESAEEEEEEGEEGEEEKEQEEEDQSCDRAETSQTCELYDGSAGIQYCSDAQQTLSWGPCIGSPECQLGEVLECGFCNDPESLECEACGDMSALCHLQDGVPIFEEACACDTPLVLSFDGAPIQMEVAPTASFDISDAGACLSTDWPAAATPWLALDRDRSGAIETGRELFGSGTRLASGERADHGFMALSEIDDNGDGVVDVRDARFSELVLWSDVNADKLADLSELAPLAMRGILSLELDYYGQARCDARGNCEGQRAEFTYLAAGGEVQQGEIVDMYLACQ